MARNQDQVHEYMSNLEHPLKKEVEAVRQIILSVDEQITEKIKWNAPSFCYQQRDFATLNLHGKGFFRLVFHCGAKVIGHANKEMLFEDTAGLLSWITGDRAIITFSSMNEVEANKEKLIEIIMKWIEKTTA